MTTILILVFCQNDLMQNVVAMSNLKVVLKVEIFHLRVVSVTQPQFLCKIVHRENGTLGEVNCPNIPLLEWNMCKLCPRTYPVLIHLTNAPIPKDKINQVSSFFDLGEDLTYSHNHLRRKV